jgi:hypothetical protein
VMSITANVRLQLCLVADFETLNYQITQNYGQRA